MTVKLFDLAMNEIIIRGVKWLEFIPSPIEGESVTEKVYNHEILLGKSTGSRSINAKLWAMAGDAKDFPLLRNEIYSKLSPQKDFWAVDEKVPGIKWRVGVQSLSAPKRINNLIAEYEVMFKSYKTYARSIGTSLDPFTYDSGLWGYGMGLKRDATAQQYIHKDTWFSIYNPSNVEVDPREDELKITLRSISATGSDIQITNETTGDVWRYQGVFQTGDSVIIDGILTKRNGLNAVGNTAPDFGLISLAVDENDFIITGITGEFEIKFEFPFLYV